MSLDDWLLALHLLSAFALVGALTIFSVAFVALRGADTPGRVLALGPVLQVGQRAVIAGVAGPVVFGVWLALSIDAYRLWDLWIVLALLGWVAASGVGMRSGALMMPLFERAEQLVAEGSGGPDAELASRAQQGKAEALHWVSTAITLLVLVDMIWKPGA